MKSTITLFFTISCLVSFSQAYFPFQKDWATWTIYEYYKGDTKGNSYQYTLSGDTLINDTTFSKIYRTDLDSNFTVSKSQFIGFLYEDSLKKVFYKGFIPNLGTSFNTFLLYDFSLKKNDTISYNLKLSNSASINHTLVVSEVDSILVNGKYRKKLYFDQAPCHWENWIEGIGSDVSLFGPLIKCHEGGPSTRCYFDSLTQFSFFGINSPSSNCFIVSVKEIEILKHYSITNNGNQITIYPPDFSTKYSIIIYNIQGKKIGGKEGIIGDIYLNVPLNHGLNILRLIDSKGISISKKIIKN